MDPKTAVDCVGAVSRLPAGAGRSRLPRVPPRRHRAGRPRWRRRRRRWTPRTRPPAAQSGDCCAGAGLAGPLQPAPPWSGVTAESSRGLARFRRVPAPADRWLRPATVGSDGSDPLEWIGASWTSTQGSGVWAANDVSRATDSPLASCARAPVAVLVVFGDLRLNKRVAHICGWPGSVHARSVRKIRNGSAKAATISRAPATRSRMSWRAATQRAND